MKSEAKDAVYLLHEEAKLYYQSLPMQERLRGLNMFKSIDKNGNGGISRSEITSLFNPTLKELVLSCFDVLDVDNSHTLNFWECVTLYYIVKVPGKMCRDCCSVLIQGPRCHTCGLDNAKTAYDVPVRVAPTGINKLPEDPVAATCIMM